jgi:hypothetical protein
LFGNFPDVMRPEVHTEVHIEAVGFLEYDAVELGTQIQTFRGNLLPSSSGYREGGGSMFLRNVGTFKHCAMKTYGGSGNIVPSFLISALNGCERLVPRSGHVTPREIASFTHWIRGFVVPRPSLDGEEKRE